MAIESITPVICGRTGAVIPVCFILDASGTMIFDVHDASGAVVGSRLDMAKSMLASQIGMLRRSSMLKDSAEVTIILCSGDEPRILCANSRLDDIDEMQLLSDVEAYGRTPLGSSVTEALRLLSKRRQVLKENGASSMQPVLSIVTDGDSTDSPDVMEDSFAQVDNLCENERLCLITAGIGDNAAMFSTLSRYCEKTGSQPLSLENADHFIEYVRLFGHTVLTHKIPVRPVYQATPISAFPICAAPQA